MMNILKSMARRILRKELDSETAEFKKSIDRLSNRDTMLEELGLNGGVLHASISHPWAVRLIAESFFDTLEKCGAENYVEMHFRHRETDKRIVVTVNRPAGKTAHEFRIEAEQARDQWKGRFERLADDALVALAGHTCTPEEGYKKAPECLGADIRRLIQGHAEVQLDHDNIYKFWNAHTVPGHHSIFEWLEWLVSEQKKLAAKEGK